MRLNNTFLNFSIFLTVAFGVFTLQVWISLLMGWDFNSLVSSFWLTSVVIVLLVLYYIKSPIKWQNGSPSIKYEITCFTCNKTQAIPALLLLVASIVLILIGFDTSFLQPWLLLIAAFSLFYFASNKNKRENISKFTKDIEHSLFETIFLAVLGLMLVTLYLFSTIGNADDTHFISFIVSLLQNPDTPLFSKDAIFNEGGQNVIFALNYGQSWEALTAIISTLTGLNHLDIYYLYLPCLFLFFVPVPLFYFTKIYFPRFSHLGVCFTLLLLISWSTYNHLQGMFFIPRFYQGKAILLSFFLPLLFLVARSFLLVPNFKTGILVCLILISAGGSSSTGLYTSILVLGLCYLSFTPLNLKSFIQRGTLIVLLMLPNIMMLGLVKYNMDINNKTQSTYQAEFSKSGATKPAIKNDSIKEFVRPIHSMYWLFGDHRYLAIFIFMFSLTFLLLCMDNSFQSKELKRFYFLLALLAFNHPLASFLSHTTGPDNLVWRFHWIIPMGFIFSLFSAGLLNFSSSLSQNTTFPPIINRVPKQIVQFIIISPVFAIASLFLFQSSGHLSSSFANSPKIHKTNSEALSLAKYIVQQEKPSDKILADNLVAEIFPMLKRQSELMTSRPLYWSHPYFATEEVYLRKRMQNIINNIDALTNEDIKFINSEIKKRNITTLVFKRKSNHASLSYINIFSNFDCFEYNNNWIICNLSPLV